MAGQIVIPDTMRRAEALDGLWKSAFDALHNSSWNAKAAAERIAREQAKDAEQEIATARACLDEAERAVRTIRSLEAQR